MRKYTDKSYGERFETMGDTSEAEFLAFAGMNNLIAVDFGLKRPPFVRFYDLPLIIRGMPDYICENAKRAKLFVECKGTGGKELKLKKDSMEALDHWNSQLTVWLFIYDSRNHRAWFQNYREMRALCEQSQILHFPDNKKPFYNVLVSGLTREVTIAPKENNNG